MTPDADDDSLKIARSWKEFLATGKIAAGAIRPEIGESWQRCREAGVDPNDGVSHQLLSLAELEGVLADRKDFVEIARHFMANLYAFVKGSGFIVLLADERGYVIESMGDVETLESAARVNLVRRANWREEKGGTNGIGTALALGRPFQVSGREHFCKKLHCWTCSAAPILDDEGRVGGVLQMSGPSHEAHLHTLGIVVAAAEAIRDQTRIRRRNRELSVLNDSLNNIFQTMSDGAIFIDRGGAIRQINPTASRLLGVQAVGRPLEEIFGKDPGTERMLNEGRAYSDVEMILDSAAGQMHALVTAKPIGNETGEVTGGVIFFNPINKMKNLVNRFGGAQATFCFDDIIGRHKKLRTALQKARKAAASVSNVIIEGESGTGKELIAQAIHIESARCKGPFLALNCAALPRDLIASELFGYAAGAFTGANPKGRPGKFEMASGGTLMLDEIGDMPLDQQASLLRVLQDKQVTRLGASRVIPVDVRVICATNKNLLEEVKKGNFREDLYYRLNVVRIVVPPLRERGRDVVVLFDHFLEKISRKLNFTVLSVHPEVRRCISSYTWPGNVRELENVVEKIINAADGGAISTAHLPPEIVAGCGGDCALPATDVNGKRAKERLAEKERQIILELLAEHAGNISRVARDMDVSRNTVYRKMQLHGICKGYSCAAN